MEQWVSDGRTIIQDRGSSLIPPGVEDDGFVDVSGGVRGLLKRPIQPGVGDAPKTYAECHCAYTYWTVRGEVADQATEEEPLEVIVGAGQVSQGFDEGLAAMREGEVAQFWLDPAFAFRENGMRCSQNGWDKVGPDEPVRLEVRLLRFMNPMNSKEKLVCATQFKDEGNAAFQKQDFEKALLRYHSALRRLGTAGLRPDKAMTVDEGASLVASDRTLRATVNSNIAACWFARGDLGRCLTFCQKALVIDKNHPKSLFRKALVLEKRCEFDAAAEILQRMLDEKLGVADDILAAKARVESLNSVQTRVQHSVYKKMFAGDSSS
jgi:hypothetical protein